MGLVEIKINAPLTLAVDMEYFKQRKILPEIKNEIRKIVVNLVLKSIHFLLNML